MKTNTLDLPPKAAAALLVVARSINGRLGGLAKSAKKAKSSAANGKASGGRPRKNAS